MMGSALPAFAADGDASLEIAISSQGANAQESGKRFDYSVSFSCSSVGATGATSCDDGVVYIPINPNLPSTVGAVKMPDWVYSVTAADSTLLAGSGVEKVSDSLLKVTLARPLAAGENASFRLEVTPPNGTTPNNTTWTLQPRIESSNAGVAVAPTAASRTATAASKIILEKTTGGTPETSDPKNSNGYPEGYVSYSIKFVAGGGAYGVIGPAFGSDLVITDTLPAQVDYVSSSVGAAPGVSSFPAGIYDAATHTVTYTVSAADFDAQHLGDGVLTIKAKIKATAVPASRFTNTASLSYQPGGAGSPTTLTSSANTTVVPFTGAPGSVTKFPYGQGGQVGTQIKLHTAYLASESSTLAGYRINLNAVLPARFAITDPIPCLANPLLGDMLGGGFVSRGVAGHCTNPALLVDELRLIIVGDPANQAPSLPVRLTHTNGTIRDVVVPKNGTLDLGPSRGRIAKVEVLNFLLEDPSYKYTLSVMGRIPDLPQFESGSLLRNNLHAGISLPGAAPTVGAQVHDTAYLQVLRSTYSAGVTNNETVYREVGTVFQTPLNMLFAFSVIPHHTFTSDDMGNKRRKGWLLPVGAVMVPIPSAPPFPGTQIENFEGTGRTLIVLEGAVLMSTNYPVSFTGLQPGVYTTDVYSGFVGTNLENCSNPSNLKINDHPELLGGTAGDGTTVCRGQHTLIITSLTPGVSVKKEVRAAGEQEWFGAPGTSRVAGDGASGAEFRISVTNTGPEVLKDVVAYDILPHVGDVGSVGGQGGVPRGTTMDPIFVSATVPAGFTAHYSASNNPCRPEVMPTNPGCVSDWSTVLPADLSMVRAIKFVSNSFVRIGASYEFIVAMDAPAFSERDVAWNTTAVSAQRLTGAVGAIPPIESPRVGFGKILPSLEVTKAANPPAGTTVKPGEVIDYTLTFENMGSATAEVSWSDLLAEVLDDADLAGAPVSSTSTLSAANQNGWLSVFGTLAPGASATVTYSVTVRADARGDNVLTNFVVENPPGEPGPPTDPPPGPGPCVTGDPLCTSHPVSAFTVLKSTTATTAARGQVVPYTITVTNTGGLAYTAADPASFTDDLSDVLDDAVYNNDASNGATVSGATLSWSGALAVGESVDISYSVTVNAASTGNDVLTNVVVPDADTGGECVTEAECTTTTPIRSFVVEKAVSATSAIAGDELTYTIMVTNTGSVAYTTVDTAAFTDDLSDVLDNAVYVAGTVTNGATVSGATLSWSGALAVGATQVITYVAKVNDPAGTDYLLENVVTPDADAGGSCVAAGACETVTPIKAFHVLKSTASTELIAGGTVVYTIEVTNTGQVPFTAADPASFTDDLVDVLDDAAYNNDADNGATYAATVLSWSGALAIGETKTITYSVTVDSPVTGDSKMDNVVVTPPGSGSNCEPGSGDLDCEAHIPGQSYTVAKTASEVSVIAGDTVTYTITVTNTGALDYTPVAPASFTDDLSDVLDDAVYNGDVTNGATVSGNTLSWSGPLAVGQTETITYSVTVKDPNTGDHALNNAVVPTTRGGSCDVAAECETSVPVAAYSVEKVASSETVNLGGTVSYTVTVTNTGKVDYTTANPATFTDDLSAVLDDATYNNDASAGASVTGSTLNWSGEVLVGASVNVTYSVTVNSPSTGDGTLTNAVLPDPEIGGQCTAGEDCTVTTPVRSFTLQKATDKSVLYPGETLGYTITVTNTGNADYTVADPAAFTDDLTAVLDDAVYNGDATGGATVAGNTLSWSGALATGASVDISYTVTVNAPNLGDNLLVNAVMPDAGVGGECAIAGECETTTPVRSFDVEKTVSATSAVAGDELTYTITVTNTGEAAYTAADRAAFTDDLSDVLDNADYVAGSVTNGATISGATLSWSGALAVGATQVITYVVKVTDPAGTDYLLENFVTPDADAGGSCVAAGACETVTPIKAFHVLKSTASTELIAGGTVVYTIEVTNTGQIAYTSADPASFTDDLVDVLDDAAYNNDADNGATYAATVLSWSGALAIGETKTITYSVTVSDPITGDSKLDNTVVTPPGSGSNCEPGSGDLDCEAHVPGQSYTVAKTVSETSVIAGDTLTYTITVTNTGAMDYTSAAPASFTDDLSAVLDDAVYNGDATNGAVVTGNTLSWAGLLAVGVSETVTYTVTVKKPNTGDHVLDNAVVPTTRGGSCDVAAECETSVPVAAFTVAKVASSETVNIGGTITYTVTVTNTGQVDYTVANPAAFTDDLTAVLDDATYNNDASAGASVTSNTLNWSGALPIGGSVDVTYSVTVNDPATGDGTLTNAVVPDTTVGGECVTAGDCTVTTPVRSFTVSKVASATSVLPGDTLSYTITVINTGNADYTAADPASFTDDLIAVLDDAVYNGDATNGATVTGSTLSWSGALAVGASLDISYTVTVNAPNTGDNVLVNAVVPAAGTGGSCEAAGECETTTPVKSFEVEKTASATSAVQGDTIVYTVIVTNTGEVAYTTADPASFTDNLADVLDDAAYNGDVTNGATVTGTMLSWSGALPIGGTQTITYSVTVGAPGVGDSVLRNVVVTPPNTGGGCAAGSTDPACGTVTPVASFKLVKTANSTEVTPGETVTYSVTVTNTGAVDYTAAAPASFTDDLSSVLDDAVYNNDADSGASYTAPELSWSGALPVGGSVTVSYSVTINDPNLGDSILLNTVVSPPATGGSCPDGSTNPECTVQIPGPALKLLKTQSSNSVLPGDTVVYTITIENTGAADFTAQNPASFSDDLVRVLDDAVYNGDVTGGATVSGGVLSWSGALASGATKTFSYSVTVNAPSTGDHLLVNAVVTPPGVTSNCAAGSTDPDCTVSAPIASFITNKTVDVQRAAPGDVVTYSITVSNTGQTAYTASAPASFTDDLSGLLDDASYNGDASGGATVVDGVLSWSGPLAVGATTVISYSVTVKATERGDHLMQNTVVPDTDTGGFCAAAGECETLTPVSSYTVLKNVSTARAHAGDRVTYTITVTNTGQVAYTDVDPATFTDDLSDVLSLARYNADASGGTSFASPVLSWAGELEVGERLEVSYSVTVNDGVKSGVLRNAVVAPPTSGGICILGSGDPDCMTETDIEIPELAFTGAEIGYGVLAALLLTAGGFWLVLVTRARQKSSLSQSGSTR